MPILSNQLTPSHSRQLYRWILIGCIMVFMMIIIGGITRLTGSGLSMTEWNVIMGAVPPMNEVEWQEAFDQYKQFPQYALINSDMTLSGFKNIFFWEYFHRIWGRTIGIVFFVPFVVFLFQKKISKRLMPKLLIAMLLGAFQGVLGWIMVKSGLVDKPWVSAYRLTAHLLTALFLYAYLLWLMWDLAQQSKPNDAAPTIAEKDRKSLRKWAWWLTGLVTLQIFFGGFMSGTHAGLHYPTWPDMNGSFMPGNLFFKTPWWINFFENVSTIQFVHRNLAYLLGILVVLFWFKIGSVQPGRQVKLGSHLMVGMLTLQILLGILTIINCVGSIPVALGAMHQAGAVLFLTAMLYMTYLFSKVPGFRDL